MFVHFETESIANAWIDKVNLELGLPSTTTKTLTYTRVRNNSDTERLDVICRIDEHVGEEGRVGLEIHDKQWAIDNGFMQQQI